MPQLTPIRIAGICIATGALWILGSSSLLGVLAGRATTPSWLQTIQWASYLLVTGGLIYLLVRSAIRQVRRSECLRQEAHERSAKDQFDYAQLERATLVGETASILNHELRTPLSTAMLNVRLVGRDLSADPPRTQSASEKLRMVDEELRRIGVLLGDQVKRLGIHAKPHREPVDVNETARDALGMIAHRARAATVETHLSLSEGPSPAAGNSGLLLQVLLNLLMNAIEAMPGGGKLDVESEQGDQTVTLRVRNSGSSINPDQLAQIFKPFCTTKPDRAGLGLAIADRLIRSMGGRISVSSKPDSGTCFEVHLRPYAGRPESNLG